MPSISSFRTVVLNYWMFCTWIVGISVSFSAVIFTFLRWRVRALDCLLGFRIGSLSFCSGRLRLAGDSSQLWCSLISCSGAGSWISPPSIQKSDPKYLGWVSGWSSWFRRVWNQVPSWHCAWIPSSWSYWMRFLSAVQPWSSSLRSDILPAISDRSPVSVSPVAGR